MPNSHKNKGFFSRFNKIISLVYGSVTISAIVLFSFLYNDNYEANIKNINLRLLEHSRSFNNILKIRYDTVKAMQRQALRFLTDDFLLFDANIKLQDDANKNLYYLDVNKLGVNKAYGMIIGQGSREKLDVSTLHELQMAFSLLPLVNVLKNNTHSVRKFHYTSENKFIFVYPWLENKEITFDKEVYNVEHYLRSTPKNNRTSKVTWSDVFWGEDKSLMVTCAAPVYKGVEFKGVVGFDFTLDVVDFFVESLHFRFGNLVVVNEQGTVIADLESRQHQDSSIIKFNNLLPEDLPHNYFVENNNATLTRVGSYWVFVANTSFAPWKIVYYVKNTDITFQTIKHVLPGLLLIIIFTTIFLIGANRLVAREFIYPAGLLVEHIANQGKLKDNQLHNTYEPWSEWFDAISDVFEQNKALVDKLEKHIGQLDDKVAQRTNDLSIKNKQLEKALIDLRKAQQQIITQEKLAGLGALTAGIAHEIRNPLNFIINFAETSKIFGESIKEEINNLLGSSDDEAKHSIIDLSGHLANNMDKIEEHGRRADAIVNSMLNHARDGEYTLNNEDIHSILDENILLGVAAFKQQGFVVKVNKNYDSGIEPLYIYKQDLGRVFLNIVNNACYALFEKQKQIEGEYVPMLTITTTDSESEITIVITDNGPGITSAIKKKIFNPFFTTKPSGEGTGLGLSLGFDIVVNQHHGKFTLDTKLKEYTSFNITIPKNLNEV